MSQTMKSQTRRDRSLSSGLNIETFEEFCDFAKANAEAVSFELEAIGVSEDRAQHTRAKTGPYTLGGQRIDRAAREYIYHVGVHKEVEEALGFTAPTDRPEATEIVLAALTGCLNAVVSTSALKRGLVLHHHEVRVRIPWDPYVFLHLTAPSINGRLHDQFGKLEVELVVEGNDITEEDIVYLQESILRYYGFLANRNRAEKLQRAKRLLNNTTPTIENEPSHNAEDASTVNESADHNDEIVEFEVCPKCKKGRLLIIARVGNFCRATEPWGFDLSKGWCTRSPQKDAS